MSNIGPIYFQDKALSRHRGNCRLPNNFHPRRVILPENVHISQFKMCNYETLKLLNTDKY